jgi:hypothetical protein
MDREPARSIRKQLVQLGIFPARGNLSGTELFLHEFRLLHCIEEFRQHQKLAHTAVSQCAKLQRYYWRRYNLWAPVGQSRIGEGTVRVFFRHRVTKQWGFRDHTTSIRAAPEEEDYESDDSDQEVGDSPLMASGKEKIITLRDPLAAGPKFEQHTCQRARVTACARGLFKSASNRRYRAAYCKKTRVVRRRKQSQNRSNSVSLSVAGMQAVEGSQQATVNPLEASLSEFRRAVAFGMSLDPPLLHKLVIDRGCSVAKVRLALELGAHPTAEANGLPPLHACLLAGDRPKVVHALILSGAGVGQKHSDLQNLDFAAVLAVAHDRPESLGIILSAGVSRLTQDGDGLSLMQMAAKRGHVSVARHLLEHDSDIDDSTGLEPMTPLIVAIVYAQLEMVDYLLSTSVDVSILLKFQFFRRQHQAGVDIAFLHHGGGGAHGIPAGAVRTTGDPDEIWEDWVPVVIHVPRAEMLSGVKYVPRSDMTVDYATFRVLEEGRSRGALTTWYHDLRHPHPWVRIPS